MAVQREGRPLPPDFVWHAKREMRKQCRQMRDDLGDGFRAYASREICRRIREWAGFPPAGVIFTYLPIRGEVDLRPLIASSPPAIRWAIPRVLEEPARNLAFHLYNPDRLIQHRYGMLEPDPALPTLAPELADLILVPGVAFTAAGIRLGYGAGYYDRLLSLPGLAPTVGACFQALLLEAIPHEPHDRRVDFLVTEERDVFPSQQAA
jgi:5-formyltetrahydrofolate cyclo-ligase